jgi:predicted dehydrogenase
MDVGVVGCGLQGRVHLECLRKIETARVVAVSDVNLERAEKLAAEFGVPCSYGDHREMLAGERLDLVTVCTMPNSHHEISVAALEAGANVLCEKPLALNVEEGRQMALAARAAGRLLTIGFNLRYASAVTAVREFMASGGLGRPVCARGWMLADDVPWWGRHYIKAVSGGGAIAATAVHMVDLLTWLGGDAVPLTATASTTRVFPRKRAAGVPSPEDAGTYDVEDLAFGHVRFDNGYWMTIEGAWVWEEPGWDYGFCMIGDRAQARIEPLRFSGERDGALADLTGEARGELDWVQSTEDEIADVVRAIEERRQPLVSIEQALKTQAIVDALYASAAEGREVAVATVGE